MTITVYSKLVCPQCDSTYRALFAAGLEFTGSQENDGDSAAFDIVVVDNNADALERIKNLGYLQAPVIVIDDDHWSGFRPDKIDELVARLKEDGATLTPVTFTDANSKHKALKEHLKASELVSA